MDTLNQNQDRGKARRDERYRLLGLAWRVSSLSRVRGCRRRRAGTNPVEVVVNDGCAHFRNLVTCGSVWSCPVCSAKIRSGRAEEIETLLKEHLGRGGAAAFTTLTVPHDLGDDLERLWEVVSDSWRRVISGRTWAALQAAYGVQIDGKARIGLIRSLEVTRGPNGWHPHLHVLVLFDGCNPVAAHAVEGVIRSRWARFVEAAGLRRPHDSIGVSWSPVSIKAASEFSQYLVKEQDGRKVGSELARHDLKVGRRSGRTPFQVLDDGATTGDKWDLHLWSEWERVSKGRQAVTLSRGIRKEFGVVEVTDEELAAAEVGGEVVYSLSEWQWKVVRSDVSIMVAVLRFSEALGSAGVELVLSRFDSG